MFESANVFSFFFYPHPLSSSDFRTARLSVEAYSVWREVFAWKNLCGRWVLSVFWVFDPDVCAELVYIQILTETCRKKQVRNF